MEYYYNLNKVMDDIEDNLTNRIDYSELAKMVGTSSYTLQRIFCFLTGITLTDYIRRRRLSKAVEELQMTNHKIIDIAIKYQYDSPVSFSRAFDKMHGVLPSSVRKQDCTLKVFPKVVFKPSNENANELEYRVLKLDEQIFYGKSTEVIAEDDKESIRKLWEQCNKDGTMKYLKEKTESPEKYYGATEYLDIEKENKTIKYYILRKREKEDFEKLIIPKAAWVAFKVNSKGQKDILSILNAIYTKWLPSSEYNIIFPYPNLEIYYEDYCEYCVAVE